MFSNKELGKDRSARDMWNGLYALEKGEETISIVEKEFKNKGFQIIELSDKEGEEL